MFFKIAGGLILLVSILLIVVELFTSNYGGEIQKKDSDLSFDGPFIDRSANARTKRNPWHSVLKFVAVLLFIASIVVFYWNEF